MKIIKEGKQELIKKTKRFECIRCGCIFEADKGEYRSLGQYNEYVYFCKCPCCGNTADEEIERGR